MNKYMDVDLIESLGAVMYQNTEFYQSDFEIDKKDFEKAVSMPDAADRTFLWLSRPCGTNCYKECDVFLKESYSYQAWQFYGEKDFKGVLAFAVEIIGNERNKIMGNLYELDFREHCKSVEQKALPIDYVRMVYERGSRKRLTTGIVSAQDDASFGKLLYVEYGTNQLDALKHILWEEKQKRERLKNGNFKKYLAVLQNRNIRKTTDEKRKIK